MTVSSATAGEREAALRLLAGDAAIDHYRNLLTTGALDPAGLFVFRDARGSVGGAMIVAVMPGALGLAWPPVTARRTSDDAADALVIAACAWLRSRGVKVCQAYSDDVRSFESLERNGFVNLTRILEMRCGLPALGSADCASRLIFAPVSTSNRAVFDAALLASYEGSLDAPELNGTRTDAELLASYADADARHWCIAMVNDEPAGVVMLDASASVISYLGVVPKFRRRGLGAQLVRFAQATAQKAGHDSLAVSVDERNHPAIHLYETLGFQASGTRFVFLASWPALS